LSSSGDATPPDPDATPDGTVEPGPDPGSSPLPDPLTPADPATPEIGSWVAAPQARPGASTFTIEGRAAPGLFVVGWLATLLGFGAIFIGVLSGGGTTSLILVGAGLALLALGLVAGAGSQGLERRARALLAYRGPSPFLVFAAALPLSVLAITAAAIPMTMLGIPIVTPAGLPTPLASVLSVLLQAIVYVLLLRLLVVDTGALAWAEMGLRRLDRTAFGDMAKGALWAVPVIVVTIPVALILGSLFTVTPESPLPAAGETSGFVLNLIAGAILAPLGEEILFRGFATTAWVRGLGERRGIVRGALFFAIVHVLTISGDTAGDAFQLAIIGFATRIPVALALGYLFVRGYSLGGISARAGSIWVPFGLHAAFNGILLVLAEAAARSGVAGV
jgi:membrane protease YdiL (CAAX protease family)